MNKSVSPLTSLMRLLCGLLLMTAAWADTSASENSQLLLRVDDEKMVITLRWPVLAMAQLAVLPVLPGEGAPAEADQARVLEYLREHMAVRSGDTRLSYELVDMFVDQAVAGQGQNTTLQMVVRVDRQGYQGQALQIDYDALTHGVDGHKVRVLELIAGQGMEHVTLDNEHTHLVMDQSGRLAAD